MFYTYKNKQYRADHRRTHISYEYTYYLYYVNYYVAGNAKYLSTHRHISYTIIYIPTPNKPPHALVGCFIIYALYRAAAGKGI